MKLCHWLRQFPSDGKLHYFESSKRVSHFVPPGKRVFVLHRQDTLKTYYAVYEYTTGLMLKGYFRTKKEAAAWAERELVNMSPEMVERLENGLRNIPIVNPLP